MSSFNGGRHSVKKTVILWDGADFSIETLQRSYRAELLMLPWLSPSCQLMMLYFLRRQMGKLRWPDRGVQINIDASLQRVWPGTMWTSGTLGNRDSNGRTQTTRVNIGLPDCGQNNNHNPLTQYRNHHYQSQSFVLLGQTCLLVALFSFF